VNALSLTKVAQMAGGKVLGHQGERHVINVCTDSRKVQPGDLFVALKGDTFDGHDYLQELESKGAVAAMISDSGLQDRVKGSLGLILVDDTLVSLQKLAQAYRRQLKVKIVAVTGSNGKTSTKEFIAAILSKKFTTHKTSGNLNNHIGVPLTILQLNSEHEWAVIEMGMNHPGELDILVELADPTWGVITKIGWAHIEAFSNQEGIAQEKASVIRKLKTTDKAFLNADDPYYTFLQGQTNAQIISSGIKDAVSVKVELKEFTETAAHFSFQSKEGHFDAQINVPAWHMAQNAGLAIALGLEAGVNPAQIVAALANCDLGKNRLKIIPYAKGLLIDDTYNASPDSMQAAFETLERLPVPGRRVALLGSMGELGAYSAQLHKEAGKKAIQSGVDLLCVYGFGAEDYVEGAKQAGATEKHVRQFDSHEMLYNFYESTRLASDVILVKGSRSQRMECVVEMLKQNKQEGLSSCSAI